MNCKPGDLAIVIGARVTPEMIGRVVEVVSLAYRGEIFGTDAGLVRLKNLAGVACWRVRSIGEQPLLWRWSNGALARAMETPCYDAYLRPVSEPPVGVETRDEIPHERA
jgi:hypothetical protein